MRSMASIPLGNEDYASFEEGSDELGRLSFTEEDDFYSEERGF